MLGDLQRDAGGFVLALPEDAPERVRFWNKPRRRYELHPFQDGERLRCFTAFGAVLSALAALPLLVARTDRRPGKGPSCLHAEGAGSFDFAGLVLAVAPHPFAPYRGRTAVVDAKFVDSGKYVGQWVTAAKATISAGVPDVGTPALFIVLAVCARTFAVTEVAFEVGDGDSRLVHACGPFARSPYLAKFKHAAQAKPADLRWDNLPTIEDHAHGTLVDLRQVQMAFFRSRSMASTLADRLRKVWKPLFDGRHRPGGGGLPGTLARLSDVQELLKDKFPVYSD
jgi:hypothetical protein